MASHEDAESRHHGADYDPNGQTSRDRCKLGSRLTTDLICWTSTTNPTEKHRGEAERHAQMAADHRAAARVLLDAETTACVGIGPADRDMSPFYHREDIARVETRGAAETKGSAQATVVFRPVVGLTVSTLQHLIDCHSARNAALGNSVPQMRYCPLEVKGVTAKVSAGAIPDEVVVVLHAEDPAGAEEMLHRTAALAPK